MTISVIVPTYNGAHRIHRLMVALVEQSLKPNEVIVVIDGSTDNTHEVLQKFIDQLNIQIIEIKNSGRAIARNTGAKASNGSLLIFYDDDMEPNQSSVSQHVSNHQSNLEALISGAAVEPYSAAKTDIQNYKGSRVQIWMAKYPTTISQPTLENLFFTTANCCLPKTLFEKLNGFDTRLTDAEDFELALRAFQKGIPVFLNPQNTAIHHDSITCKSYIHRIRAYRQAHKALRTLHPSWAASHMEQPKWSIKMFAYRIMANRLWVKWIDQNRFLWLPTKFRYRFYDLIIHSLSVVYPSQSI